LSKSKRGFLAANGAVAACAAAHYGPAAAGGSPGKSGVGA
jgi:hypothetical protein